MSTTSSPAGMRTFAHVDASPARLRAARAELGLTQQQLAEKVGVTRNTVATMERGKAVRGSTMLAVTRALGIGPDDAGTERTRLLVSLTDAELLAEVAARLARRPTR